MFAADRPETGGGGGFGEVFVAGRQAGRGPADASPAAGARITPGKAEQKGDSVVEGEVMIVVVILINGFIAAPGVSAAEAFFRSLRRDCNRCE